MGAKNFKRASSSVVFGDHSSNLLDMKNWNWQKETQGLQQKEKSRLLQNYSTTKLMTRNQIPDRGIHTKVRKSARNEFIPYFLR